VSKAADRSSRVNIERSPESSARRIPYMTFKMAVSLSGVTDMLIGNLVVDDER